MQKEHWLFRTIDFVTQLFWSHDDMKYMSLPLYNSFVSEKGTVVIYQYKLQEILL